MKTAFYRLPLLLLACCVLGTSGLAQSSKEKKLHKRATSAMEFGRFAEAIDYYLQLLDENATHPGYFLETGIAHWQGNIYKEKALPYFEQALTLSTSDTIPDIHYYLGISYQHVGAYNQAIANYQAYASSLTSEEEDQEAQVEVKRYIKMCESGLHYLENQRHDIHVKHLSEHVNSAYPEYAPVFFKTKEQLIFTSRRPGSTGGKKSTDDLPYEDIYVSGLVNGDFQASENIDASSMRFGSALNTKRHDAAVAFSQDYSTFYVYRNNKLLKTTQQEDQWSELSRLDKDFKASFHLPSIYIAPTQNFAILVMRKFGSSTGRDLYILQKGDDNTWQEPTKMGEHINTNFDEDAPFLTADGDTLFFSSKGHNSFGGYDIFRCVRNASNNTWSKPENMGMPINSPADDIYYVHDPLNQHSYFSSNRAKGLGSMDIYQVRPGCLPADSMEFNGLLLSGIKQVPTGGTLTLTANGESQVVDISPNGFYSAVLDPETSYDLQLTAQEGSAHKATLTTPFMCAYNAHTVYQVVQCDTTLKYDQVATDQATFKTFYENLEGYYTEQNMPALSGDKQALLLQYLNTVPSNLLDVQRDLVEFEVYPPEVTPTTDTAVEDPLVAQQKKESDDVPSTETSLDNDTSSNSTSGNASDTQDAQQVSDSPSLVSDQSEKTSSSDTETTSAKTTTNPNNAKATETDVTATSDFQLNPIYFDFDSYALRTSSKETLNQVYSYMMSSPKSRLDIVGHTDWLGSSAYNVILSKKRATAALDYLKNKGIAADRLHVVSKGEETPAAPNADSTGKDLPQNRQLNRRVEFILHENSL